MISDYIYGKKKLLKVMNEKNSQQRQKVQRHGSHNFS